MEKYNIKIRKNKSYIYFNPIKDDLDDIKTILEHTFDVECGYSHVMDYVNRMVYTKFLSRDINENYITQMMADSDAIIILSDSNGVLPNGNIFSFATLDFNDTFVYISIFCSHKGIYGAGEILLNEIECLCKTLFMTSIHLTSIKNAITFYEKYGFIRDGKGERVCKMSKTVGITKQYYQHI